jgi:hypothetical protein
VRFVLPSAEIYLNAEIGLGGEARMELLSAEGTPIPGFEISRCVPLGGDSLKHRVCWRGQPDLAAMVGKQIRWRLRATRAKVYSVWIPDVKNKAPYYRFQTL